MTTTTPDTETLEIAEIARARRIRRIRLLAERVKTEQLTMTESLRRWLGEPA